MQIKKSKLLIPLFLFIVLVSITYADPEVYTFVKPAEPITDLSFEPKAGGSLTDGQEYHWVVIGINSTSNYYWDYAQSGISNEVNFTANATHKSVNLTWTRNSGAAGFGVYRTESGSDTYCTDNSGRTRLETAASSSYYPTTNDDYLLDDGTRDRAYLNSMSVLPENFTLPCGVIPREHGIGEFSWKGGTEANPVNFTGIYNNLTGEGYENYTYFDGLTFCLLANWNTRPYDTQEKHFKENQKEWIQYGRVRLYNSHVDSTFQLGTKNADTSTEDGVNIVQMGGTYNIWEWHFENAKLYDVTHTAIPSEFIKHQPFTSSYYMNFYDEPFDMLDVKFQNFYYLMFRKDVAVKNIVGSVGGYIQPIYCNMSKMQNLKTKGRFYASYRHQYRVDEFISTKTSTQLYMKRYNVTFIDPYSPSSTSEKWYGKASMSSSTPLPTYYQFNSLIIKVLDTDGNPLIANISIEDKSGDDLDFDKTTLTKIETDSTGYFWREKIDITSATINTITDSSKSWTTNQWYGRNIRIVSGDDIGDDSKVCSNTADTLTLCYDLITTPSAGDKAGIIAEVQTVEQTYSGGQEFFNPYTITVEKEGKQTHELVFNISSDFIINKDKIILIRLRDPPPPVYLKTGIRIGSYGGISLGLLLIPFSIVQWKSKKRKERKL